MLLSVQSTSYAEVYKWTDNDGQIHYSDQPKANDAEKVIIRGNTTTKPRQITADTEDNSEPAETTPDKSEELTEAQSENKPKMVEIEPSRKEKKRWCDQAKQDIAAINSRGRMREVNSKGEYVYLSEQERQQRLSAAKKKQKEFCR
jgi:type IV secretory pathway VirJ component